MPNFVLFEAVPSLARQRDYTCDVGTFLLGRERT